MNFELEGRELQALVKEWQGTIELLAELLSMPVCTILQQQVDSVEVLSLNRMANRASLTVGSLLPMQPAEPPLDRSPVPELIPGSDHTPSYFLCSCSAIYHDNGSVFGFLCTYDTKAKPLSRLNQKVIAQVKMLIEKVLTISENNKKFKQLSEKDYLTSLYNRRAFFKHAEAEQERAARLGQQIAFLYIDLDHFKDFNDKFGHKEGDQLLMAVANCLSLKMRRYDILARFGGEEFVVLLSNMDLDGAIKKADFIRKCISLLEPDCCPKPNTITASVGVSVLEKNEAIEQAIYRADDALYLAKEAGRNQIRVARKNPRKEYIKVTDNLKHA